jgi:hypothetical protein
LVFVLSYFALRQNRYKPKENNKSHSQDETPMEVDHFRPKRCYKCKRQGHLAPLLRRELSSFPEHFAYI